MKNLILTILCTLTLSISVIPEEFYNFPRLGGNDIGNGSPMKNHDTTLNGGNDIGNGRGHRN